MSIELPLSAVLSHTTVKNLNAYEFGAYRYCTAHYSLCFVLFPEINISPFISFKIGIRRIESWQRFTIGKCPTSRSGPLSRLTLLENC
jgi:hypothetical protein